MQGIAPTRGLATRMAPYALTILGAACVQKASFLLWEWAAPFVRSVFDSAYETLITAGLTDSLALHVASYLTYGLLAALNFLSGGIIGALTRDRWRRFAIIFALCLLAIPYVLDVWAYRASAKQTGWTTLAIGMLVRSILIIPWVMLGAWFASRPRKRRCERRRAAGLCEACGYSLAGNTTSICPECGTSTIQKTNRPLMAEVIRHLKWPDPGAGQENSHE